jgi:hypothetical protein
MVQVQAANHFAYSDVWNGFKDSHDLMDLPPQHYINVQDAARLHVAALIYKEIKNERLLGYLSPSNWNHFLAALRKSHP